MKVFISWSGAASRSVAEALADWFPKVIQGVQPFVSAKDIDKGANWTVELARELEGAQFGVICLAPDNLLSPWLNYEAGAITKSVNSRACPVLLGVQKSDVRPPISQLQMTSIEKDDFMLLMSSMNKAAGSPLPPLGLQEAVSVWWPMLQAAIDDISVPAGAVTLDGVQEPAQPESSATEMLTELLHRVRQMDARLGRVERAPMRVRPSKRPPYEDLLDAVTSHGLTVSRGTIKDDTVEIVVNKPLPDVLPGHLHQLIGEYAKTNEQAVRIVGPDRSITFDTNGYSDEPPF